MELSILVAKMAALVYLAAGIGALSGALNFKKLADDFTKSSGLTFISGFMTLIAGVALVEFHNFWVKDWTVLVTIIGWACLLKGLMLMVYPKYLSTFKSVYKNNKFLGLLLVVLGLVFGYFGFLR
jgi:uncharacterized membrane protein HdeD (DUF308 family)